MKFAMIFMTTLAVGSTAHAHGGHWTDLAGHDHWLAAGALAAAAAVAAWAALHGKKDDAPEADAEDVPEGQDA